MDTQDITVDPEDEIKAGLTRRSMLARAGVVGGAALAVPLVGALARPGLAFADDVAPAPPSIWSFPAVPSITSLPLPP